MSDRDRHHGLMRLLAATARAHHEATGGINSNWAQWYAEYLSGDIDEFVNGSPSVETIRDWLVQADESHRADDPDGRWPPFYATIIIEKLSRG
jgi:hypothetical protein